MTGSRRSPRRWRTAAGAAWSLVTFLAAAWVLRPRGNRVDTYFYRTPDRQYWLVTLYPGRVALERSTSSMAGRPGGQPAGAGGRNWGSSSGFGGGWPAPKSVWNRLGFWYWPNSMKIVQPTQDVIMHHTWVVPRWFVLSVTPLPAGVWMVNGIRRQRRRRRNPGLCTACGYDLTGNVSGTCPECGTAAYVASKA